MSTPTKPKTVIYLAAIFAAGAISGALVSAKLRHPDYSIMPPAEIAQRIHHRLETKLKITPDQFRVIDPLIDKEAHEVAAVHRDVNDKILTIISNTHAQFSSTLTPDQQAAMEKMDAERRDRLRKLMPPP